MSTDGKGNEIPGTPIAYWKCGSCDSHLSHIELELGVCMECKNEGPAIPVHEPMEEEC